ncbi:MAG: hypothetical protein L0387_36480 [Acidobacteria bacterium]|nr:hypothetical protein [Acidobacteriota bacterium]MCI0722073.1 hypothetical protein [Acidobacteriota bacterium]
MTEVTEHRLARRIKALRASRGLKMFRWNRRCCFVKTSLILVMSSLPVIAHEPVTTRLTWTQEISRIFYRRCLSCHSEKSSIPLVAYDQVRPWAKAISEEVRERRMPPWGAVRGFGEFRDDASLTLSEIEMIVHWVEGGAPRGEDIYLPEVPDAERPQYNKPSPGFLVTNGYILRRDFTAAGIRPAQVIEGGSIQVSAILPDGGVRNLVWVRDYRKGPACIYWFRDAIGLPKRTRLLMHPPGTSASLISTAKPER